MKLSEVVVGSRYAARVSGRVVPVTVISRVEPTRFTKVTRFIIRNERTGRTTTATAQRLRKPLTTEQLKARMEDLKARTEAFVASHPALFPPEPEKPLVLELTGAFVEVPIGRLSDE